MVTRSEQVVYGLMSVLFLTVYQLLVQPYVASSFSEYTFAHALAFNVAVWFFSAFLTFILIWRIKHRNQEGNEA